MTKVLVLHPSIRNALWATWEAIASDLFECAENYLTRAEVIETVLDADRLEMYGGCRGQHPLANEINETFKDEVKKFRALPYKDQVKLAKLLFIHSRYC